MAETAFLLPFLLAHVGVITTAVATGGKMKAVHNVHRPLVHSFFGLSQAGRLGDKRN